ncbi:ABC transporter permease [Devosia geojensis]|uniref:ABC transporter permease n=1 Tax=Devosia geojensis TaxID=443610 RepID=A0A0F5FQC4_9HYPH|nr:ABC transporter permease [Devosia geojensis]KKB11046.1 ABC transporter permease [Devosia geojensis]
MSQTSTLPAGTPAAKRPIRALLGHPFAGVAMLLVFYLLLIAAFSALSPFFLTVKNLLSIGSNMAFIGLMAAAGTPLIVAGGLDLSVAAVAGISGVVVALCYAAGIDIWAACLIAVAAGGLIGAGNGALTNGLKLNPFIVTLGTMSIITGASLVLTGGLTQPLMIEGFNWIGSGRIGGSGGVPVPLIIMLVAFVLIWWMMAFTPFGRYIYASGGNPEASRMLGIPVDRTQVTLYILSGISGAIAGIIVAAMLGAAAPDSVGKHLLTVIAAIILGGTSLFGGRGSVWGTLLAVLILGTLNNGLTLMNVSSFWQDVTKGAVLLLAVGLDQLRVRSQA